MSDLPCKNPSCNSYGSPHPYCKCYGEMARGGDVSFCSENRRHHEDCQYFQSGGMPEKISDADMMNPGQFGGPSEESFTEASPEQTPEAEDFTEASPDQIQEPESFTEASPAEQTYGGNVQEALRRQGASLEGLGRGIGGGLFTGAELLASKTGIPGLSSDEINQRQQDYPTESAMGDITGQALTFGGLNKILPAGDKVLKAALSNVLIQGGDEISKAFLGQGDPEQPVSSALTHMGIAALIPLGLGAAGEIAKSGYSAIAKSFVNSPRISSFLSGLSIAAANPDPLTRVATDESSNVFGEALNKRAYKLGQSLYDYSLGISARSGDKAILGLGLAGATFGARAGYDRGSHFFPEPGVMAGIEGGAEGFLGGILGGIGGKLALGTSKYIPEVLLRIMSNGPTQSDIAPAIEHAVNAARGESQLSSYVDQLTGFGSRKLSSKISQKDVNHVKDFIGSGHIIQGMKDQMYQDNEPSQGFSDGGLVKDKPASGNIPSLLKDNDCMAQNFPEQHALMQAAKGRVTGYLSSLRPQQNQQKLPFDEEPDNREANKEYESAIRVALKPLTVLDHIQDGTIDANQIKHLTSMYPEVTSHIQNKITEGIVKAQVKGNKPSYKVRQGLSMLMGIPLSGEMTPANIQAAQGVYMPQQPQPSAGGLSKKGSSGLAKASNAYLTSGQAREERANKV